MHKIKRFFRKQNENSMLIIKEQVLTIKNQILMPKFIYFCLIYLIKT